MTKIPISRMPFGAYAGEELTNIPAEYLIHFYNLGLLDEDVKKYVEDNLEEKLDLLLTDFFLEV